MNMLNVDDVKWIEDSVDDIKKISEKITVSAPNIVEKTETISDNKEEPKTAFDKMKAFVRKAVDCCIE